MDASQTNDIQLRANLHLHHIPGVLQCVAVCCSVLKCVAVNSYNTASTSTFTIYQVCCSVLQCVAVCCSALQSVAACCSVLQCVTECCSVLQCVAVCCSVLQCVYPTPRQPSPSPHPRCSAVRCRVLQFVALCRTLSYSALQFVAVHCTVLQLVALCVALCSFDIAANDFHLQRDVGGGGRKPRSINKGKLPRILVEIMRWGFRFTGTTFPFYMSSSTILWRSCNGTVIGTH